VCLGNICRSPMAEALFLDKAKSRGITSTFEVDSCGTGDWHIGQLPDKRTIETLQNHGIEVSSTARQIRKSDLDDYDYILVMDRSNYSNVTSILGRSDKIKMMRDYDSRNSGADVPDPYFGGTDGFENVFSILDEATENLLDELVS